jgi:Zn finger protein HypA/HybF involved in hydrogenase expression
MPIKPMPFTFECGDCGWKKVVAPLSDCLGPGDWFERCPKCGNEKLQMKQARWLERKWAELRLWR